MPGSITAAIKRRQLRHLGNKSSIPNKHPDGNKGTMAPGPFGRAASSQFASAKGKGTTYQGGAEFSDSSKPSGDPVQVGTANQPTGYRSSQMDKIENKQRDRTPAGAEQIPGVFSKGALSRRQKGGNK
jgi:hypothetical protein